MAGFSQRFSNEMGDLLFVFGNENAHGRVREEASLG
jgi:hypothetical protein